MDLVFECIDMNEPMITSIFEVYFTECNLMEWIDSFTLYIDQIDSFHMKMTITHLAELASTTMNKINECRTDLIKGVYDAYLQTRDKDDAIETILRIIHRNFKWFYMIRC